MNHRRDAMKSLLMLLAAGTAQGAETGRLPDAVLDLKQGKMTKHPFGELTTLFTGSTDQLKGMTAGSLLLYPGQEPHPPHQHPEEEFMLITEGTGTLLVHGKQHDVGPGSLMYCEGNHMHGIKNTSSAPMRFYFFKWSA